MTRTQRQTEHIVLVKAAYECQPESTCRHTVTFATMVCYAKVLFQTNFSLCRSTRCLRNMRRPTRWLGSGLRNGAHRASQNVTVHRLSAYSQDLLFTAHLMTAVCIKPKERKKVAHAIHALTVPHTHNPSWSTLGLHFARSTPSRPPMSGVQGYSFFIHSLMVFIKKTESCCIFLSMELGSNAPRESPLIFSISPLVSNFPNMEDCAAINSPPFFQLRDS